jgi:hypothetical protein
MKDPQDYDLVSGAVLLVGIYAGVLPFAVKLGALDFGLAVTTHLPGPWWWIVSLLVIAGGLVALGALDRARKRLVAREG